MGTRPGRYHDWANVGGWLRQAVPEVAESDLARELEREAIGYLTTPVDIPGWIRRVRERFVFLRDLDEEEQLISRCSEGEEWLVRRQIEDSALEPGAPKPPAEL
jgi:hypothetical protein